MSRREKKTIGECKLLTFQLHNAKSNKRKPKT